MPVVSACIQSARHCFCYTQQGSRIFDMTEASCADRLQQGVHFNPYARPVQVAAVSSIDASKRSAAVAGSSVSDMSWKLPAQSQNLRGDLSQTLPPSGSIRID